MEKIYVRSLHKTKLTIIHRSTKPLPLNSSSSLDSVVSASLISRIRLSLA